VQIATDARNAIPTLASGELVILPQVSMAPAIEKAGSPTALVR
jgi:hypothetical protein